MRIFAAFILCMALSGCTVFGPSAAQRATQQDHVLSAGFVKSMNAGKTTRDEEQAHIITMDKAFKALDAAENGTAAEQQTELLINPAATTKGN